MECLNMVGGECISVSHMILFIVSLVVIGWIGGWISSKTYYTNKPTSDEGA